MTVLKHIVPHITPLCCQQSCVWGLGLCTVSLLKTQTQPEMLKTCNVSRQLGPIVVILHVNVGSKKKKKAKLAPPLSEKIERIQQSSMPNDLQRLYVPSQNISLSESTRNFISTQLGNTYKASLATNMGGRNVLWLHRFSGHVADKTPLMHKTCFPFYFLTVDGSLEMTLMLFEKVFHAQREYFVSHVVTIAEFPSKSKWNPSEFSLSMEKAVHSWECSTVKVTPLTPITTVSKLIDSSSEKKSLG